MPAELTKQQILDFLADHKVMVVSTYGEFPWIATVYYVHDKDMNIYFLSSPETLHAKQIQENPEVAVAIMHSEQEVKDKKKGMQISGVAQRISGLEKVKYALDLWKKTLGVVNPKLIVQAVGKSMYKITPRRIKLFDQELFDVADGLEPVMDLS